MDPYRPSVVVDLNHVILLDARYPNCKEQLVEYTLKFRNQLLGIGQFASLFSYL